MFSFLVPAIKQSKRGDASALQDAELFEALPSRGLAVDEICPFRTLWKPDYRMFELPGCIDDRTGGGDHRTDKGGAKYNESRVVMSEAVLENGKITEIEVRLTRVLPVQPMEPNRGDRVGSARRGHAQTESAEPVENARKSPGRTNIGRPYKLH